ncbi:hypothetical protein SCP_2100120 [Sparassis crispa]|uniref:Uncharacterized protein n=1 Tax=Sparassis crispa TaxID=139825 RepID=A0A401H751_9APHY|nr:hypothetical protein SCP_2100080 [Sparassis crispa]XP_027621192.1 hypothetical protein SCP_2100120 [Sparassis crispa]GBE90278.1 hypothetical protein SCP_2100080 [Sparassis crispa]GBE90279.1 hypothetical protein SCP_2100120 [Sparassis crispa]
MPASQTRKRPVFLDPDRRIPTEGYNTPEESTPSRFHILFNSLSKVLFIFPSRYLFAIGLSPIFSFRWNLPPILSCIPKQLDSSRAHHKALAVRVKDGIVTLYDALFQETCTRSSADVASPDYNSDDEDAARF